MHVYGSNLVVIDTGIVTHADTVYLDYSFDVHCVAIQKNPFAAFVNLSYACKCDECGSMGLKDSIVSLNITSDTTYNGIEPGSSLNAFFKVVYSLSDTISVDSLKTYVNTNRSRMYAERMFTTTKPGNDKGHIFVLHIVFAGGREVFISSKTIFWT